jgi:hypothetical protein
MHEPSSEIEAKVEVIVEALQQLERRVAALERGRGSPPPAVVRPGEPTPEETGQPPGLGSVSGAVTFVGRTLLVLAGAFVLRALTDSGTLPTWLGVGLGLGYAGIWIALADRAGRGGGRVSAAFHGSSAVIIGYPLLYEAVTRFHLLSGPAAAALLAALTAVALAVAARRDLRGLAWPVAVAGIPTAVALASATGDLSAFALYLVLLGVATLWLGYVRDWRGLRWPTALAADLLVVVVGIRATSPSAPEGPGAALAIQLALLLGYLGSIAVRTLLLGRGVVAFEVFQAPLAIAAGLGGAVFVALRSGAGAWGFGAAAVLLGVAAYAVAFAFVERRQQSRANFAFYSSIAILFVIAGVALLSRGAPRDLSLAALALAAGAAFRRFGRRTLAAHAAAYAVAAAVGSGLVARALDGILASQVAALHPTDPTTVLVLAAAAGTAWLAAEPGFAPGLAARVPRLLLLLAVALGGAGLAIHWLAPLLPRDPAGGADPGAVATLRTAVLATGAMALAWIGRRQAWLEAGWLAYPLLGAIALKILAEDLRRSRPATLFLAFALYGAALILVPRLRRARPHEVPERARRGPAARPPSGGDA